MGVSGLARWVTTALRAPRARYAIVVPVLVGVPLLLAQVQLTRYWDQRLPAAYVVAYRELGRWLAERTPAGSSVGTLEIGLLGYYSGRRMIDFAGLLQPPIARHVAHDDFLWAVEAYRPDYVVWSPQRDYWLTNSAEFAARYHEIYRFPNLYLDPLIVSERHLEN